MHIDNTSGQGRLAAVPAEIDRWNWGAFLLNWIWGIGNNTFLALLMFVPLVNVFMLFALGARGSTWAWRNKRWESVEAFRRTQRKWAQWALVIYLLLIVLIGGAVALALSQLKGSEVYRRATEVVVSDAQARALLGAPIRTGMPTGSISESGPDGSASLSFSATGSLRSGTVYFEASRNQGRWDIDGVVLELDDSHERVVLR